MSIDQGGINLSDSTPGGALLPSGRLPSTDTPSQERPSPSDVAYRRFAADQPARATVRSCSHCGEPAGYTTSEPDEKVFCCRGCRHAFELIEGLGLEDFYALRDSRVEQNRIALTRTDYRLLDSDEYLGASAPRTLSDGTKTTTLAIHGLHCAACAWLIENVASRTTGWLSARVKLNNHTLRIVFNPNEVRLSEIAQTLHRIGYELSPLTTEKDGHVHREERRLLTQIAIAGFCAANAMWIAIALYAGEASGLAASHQAFFRWFGTGLGLTAVVFPGRAFLSGAIAAIRTRTPHMDLPVSLGLGVGAFSSLVAAVNGHGDVYFDSLSALVFLLLLGRWIQFRQQSRAAKSVDLLLRVTPQHARRVLGRNRTQTVLTDTLKHDDTVRVAAGEEIPADGRIVEGDSTLDRSLLTGESRPVACRVGDEVCAGMVNRQGQIDVRVTAVGSATRVGKVMQAVEQATARKTPIVQLADRVGGIFVVVVTLLSATTFAAWLVEGWEVASANATAMLIVACPCALALATPLAVAVTIGRAAKHKLLIRDSGSLQRLATTGVIWFDKTGTLTTGRPTAEVVAGDASALAPAAAVERECRHPVADAIVAEAERRQLAKPTVGGLCQASDGGVRGLSGQHTVDIGNLKYLQSRNAHIAKELLEAADRCSQCGWSPVMIAIDGVATTVLSVRDRLKPDAKLIVQRLVKRGWRVGILSGDDQKVVRQVAQQLDIPQGRVRGGLSPEEKLAVIEDSRPATVVMIGDGANDAAALAAADVGIAVRGGAEVSLHAAPIYVSSSRLSALEDLFLASTRMMFLIRTTFTTSLAYNLIAAVLAMSGRISPLVAAILMPISSVTVLFLTLAWPILRRPVT